MKKCFLCGGCDNTIDFSDSILTRCLNFIELRKKKNFKYGDLEFSREMATDLGYHTECYKKISALKRKYREEFDAAYSADKVSLGNWIIKIIYLSNYIHSLF